MDQVVQSHLADGGNQTEVFNLLNNLNSMVSSMAGQTNPV
jgi:hypothetical protein